MDYFPKIATGKIVPGGVAPLNQQIKEAKEKAKEKREFRHDWIIAIFGIVGGGIMGLVTSFIFWLCTK